MYGMNPYFGYNTNLQQPIQNKPLNLQGKVIDNLEVVKATDIALDGSINYFPFKEYNLIVLLEL